MHGLHEQEAGSRPDVVSEGEVFSRDVDESLRLVGGDGVVDQTVHGTEGVDRCRDDPLGAVRIAQVGDQLFDAAGRSEFIGGRGQLFVVDVDQQHRCSPFEKRCRDAFSDTLRAPGDDRDVAAHRVGVGVAHVADARRAAGRPANSGRSR
jgi:hypothetical protein